MTEQERKSLRFNIMKDSLYLAGLQAGFKLGNQETRVEFDAVMKSRTDQLSLGRKLLKTD